MNPNSPRPRRHTPDLLVGRYSLPATTYFITMCETHRRAIFARESLASAVHAVLEDLHQQGDFRIIAAILMPDHLHLLGILGTRLSLPRVIGKFKTQTKRHLVAANAEWQENFYEHRLRDSSDSESFVFYLFLNPYRAKLIDLDRRWPFYWRMTGVRYDFEDTVDRGAVPAAWLDEPEPVGVVDF